MNKYDKYNEIKQFLISQGIQVALPQEINFGIQFDAIMDGNTSKVRIYESKKKGITVDLSQVKYQALKELIDNINSTKTCTKSLEEKYNKENTKDTGYLSDQLEVPLIGVDESGKGDYFGPLVIAGVYADKETKLRLMSLGAMDSKALSDKQIRILANKIRELCTYNVVVLNNETYNKVYDKIGNLNKLLAWGHARVIENLVGETDCKCALSDQFGNESLIKEALMEKGKGITLEQKPRGEENIVVAAASIIARDEFVKRMESLEAKYGQAFPKGASTATVSAAKQFARDYGKDRLGEVGKLHFKTTQNI